MVGPNITRQITAGLSRRSAEREGGLPYGPVPYVPIDPAARPAAGPPAAETFARLFEAVHEGVYIGVIDAAGNSTLFANPFLKLMFGFAADATATDVRPFEPDRFVDPQARDQFLDRLKRDGAVSDYLLRLRRVDLTLIWIEVTAHAEPGAKGASSASRP